MARVAVKALAVVVLAAASCGTVFYQRYPGFVRGLSNQLYYADATQNRNLYVCIMYWLQFMQELRFNQHTGVYGFDSISDEGLTDTQRAEYAFHRGEFDAATAYFERAVEKEGTSEDRLFWLAASYMRKAEVDNCLHGFLALGSNGTGDAMDHDGSAAMCRLPLVSFHTLRESARQAATLFERLLDRYGPNRLYQWLLNVNYMTLGEFPSGVPSRYRINTPFIDAFYGPKAAETAHRYADLSFVERAHELHIDTYNTGRGIAIEDFDHDGYLDIVTGGSFDDVRYYANLHGTDFVDRTVEVGLANVKQPFIIVAADYDNDGWVDLFISRPFGRYALFRNVNGHFQDVTAASGLLNGLQDDEITATWVPAFADVNNDGYLDLFVAQWGFRMPFVRNLMARPRSDSKLFINDHGIFKDRTAEFGLLPIVRNQYFIGAAFGDFDSDGYPDLFLSSPLLNTSVLLRNRSGRRFEPVATGRVEGGFAAAFMDFDQDGRPDIFQAGFGDARTSTAQAVFGEGAREHRAGHSTVLLQTENGRFDDRSDLFDMPMSTMGSSYGDIDNDGCYDFYLGTGNPESWFVLPNLMYMGVPENGRCGVRLANISMLFGLGTLQKGHGVVFFDFNNDGLEDIYSSLGGMWPGDAWPNQMFVNTSRTGNAWTKIRLRGRKTNSFGVGARITVRAVSISGQPITRYFTMDNKTGFGSTPYLAHIGLGTAVHIDAVDVWWPTSGCRQRYFAELRQLNVLDEAVCWTR